MSNLMFLAPVLGIAALLFAYTLAKRVDKEGEGTARMSEIAASIRDGANAFFYSEYKILIIFAAVLFVLIAVGINVKTGVYYYITYDNLNIEAVDMHHEDLEGDEVISYPLVETMVIHKQN